MAASVLTIEDAKQATLNVIEDGKGSQAVHDVVVAMRANRRSGTANTKTRAEVRGSGKKLWRQKGTGRARMGTRQSPIWTGGGVAFGPRPRDYSKDVNKLTRRLAFRRALTERITAGDVLIVDSFGVADGKTKSFIQAIREFGDSPKVLIISASFEESTYLAARNVKQALLMSPEEVNVEHLLYYNKIVIARDAFETLAKRTAAK